MVGWVAYGTSYMTCALGSGCGLTSELRQRANSRMMGRQSNAQAQIKTLCRSFLGEGPVMRAI